MMEPFTIAEPPPNAYVRSLPSNEDYVKTLTTQQVARWLCLFDGVDTILKHSDAGDADILASGQFQRIDRALVAYMNERYNTVHADLLIDIFSETVQ